MLSCKDKIYCTEVRFKHYIYAAVAVNILYGEVSNNKMGGIDFTPPPPFCPDSAGLTGERWTAWKEKFNFYLLAKDLNKATVTGERKVAVRLTCMGKEAIKLYGTFTFTAAIAASNDMGIHAGPAEDKNDLKMVLHKFDQHYGSKK